MALKPTKKTASKPVDDETEATPVAEIETNEDAADETAESAPEATVEAPVAPKTKAKVGALPEPAQVANRVDVSAVKRADLVVVTMHETIQPPPRVGTYNVQHELGVTELTQRKNYRLPKFVAEVLVDAGKAEYIQVEG